MRKDKTEGVCCGCGIPLGNDDKHSRCPECRRLLKKKQMEAKEHYNPNFHANKQLDADCVEAAKQGMSYGKWRALQEMKKMREGRN